MFKYERLEYLEDLNRQIESIITSKSLEFGVWSLGDVASKKKVGIIMEVQIFIKGTKEPLIYKGDRIDILDFNLNGGRPQTNKECLKKGRSKSELIKSDLIKR